MDGRLQPEVFHLQKFLQDDINAAQKNGGVLQMTGGFLKDGPSGYSGIFPGSS